MWNSSSTRSCVFIARFPKPTFPTGLSAGPRFFLQVSAREAGAGSTTRDVAAAIRREDLARIIEVAEENGFRYRHSAGIDMLLDVNQPIARSAIHLVFIGEKVRPEYVESVPGFSESTVSVEGVLIAPVADLVRMKLTSFREKDRVMCGISIRSA